MTSPPPDLETLTAKQRALLVQRLLAKRQAKAAEGSLAAKVVASVPKRPGLGPTPLSFAQKRLWFLERLQPAQPIYHLGLALRLRGELDLEALRRGLEVLLKRHESLRTCFATDGGEPVQVVQAAEASPRVSFEAAEEDLLEKVVLREVERPFDLEQGPLWRASVVEIGQADHLFLFVVHHIITDGWSQEVLARELGQLYGDSLADLPELAIQYADFAVWQRHWLSQGEMARQLDYWRHQLTGLPTLELPWDHARPSMPTYRGHRDEFQLSPSVAVDLERVCGATGSTPFMVLTAVLAGLLSRYAGQRELALGTPVSGRQRPELDSVVGFFVNMLVLRLNSGAGPRFEDWVKRVREVVLEGFAHQDLPFEKLVEELDPERQPGRNPLFQATFSAQNFDVQDVQDDVQNREQAEAWWPGLEVQPFVVGPEAVWTRFDLEVSARSTAASARDKLWRIRFVVSSDLFDKTTARRLARHGHELLQGALANPEQSLEALPMFSIAEQCQLTEFSGVSTPLFETTMPEMTITRLFEAQAARRPAAVALQASGAAMTYGTLNRRANRFAHHLIRRGVGPESTVGLCVERGLSMVASILAILKAGGAYVPIDPDYPADRRAFILRDSDAKLLISQRDDCDGEAQSEENPPSRASLDSLAYIIYTSGSTGLPKGVSVPHRGVVRLVHEVDYVDLGPREIFLQLAPISFDASTFELWGSLLHGAKLVIFPPVAPSFEELGQALEIHRISTLWLTSALFQQMVSMQGPRLGRVRQVLSGGEALPLAHVRRALAALPAGHRLINGYGPTENTTFTCCHGMTSVSQLPGSVPIGRPISHTRSYVVDRSLRLVPVGVVGELVTGGAGLARGYLNRPRLTAGGFAPDSLGGAPGARLYKTGDLVRYLVDGRLEFLGRADHQIKMRGFRIELGEIESALQGHPSVARAVILLIDSTRIASISTDSYLKAFWVRSAEVRSDPVSASELRAHLGAQLPQYMVPISFTALDEVPLTPHGKVDRQALKRMAVEQPRSPGGAKPVPSVAAQDALERQLISLWEQVLKRNPIGIHDDFFELGGHSLLAIRLFALIENSFGRALPISTLFQTPTVAELAALLRDRGWAMRWSSIVPIHPWGDRPPLFCVHGVTGDPFIYRTLVGHLPPDQPLYGVQSRGLAGEAEPFTRIEDMAAYYLKEIRDIQPQGPYLLGGFCFGGYTAFEIARQVLAQGEEVALLALFDTPAPITSALPPRVFLGHRLRQISRFARHHVDRFRTLPWSGKLPYLWDRRHGLRRMRLSTLRLLRTLGLGLAPSVTEVDVAQANRLALRRFRPGPYPRAVTVFRSQGFPEHGHHDPLLGWEALAAEVSVHDVSGEHHGMFDEPRVGQLSGLLAAALESVRHTRND